MEDGNIPPSRKSAGYVNSYTKNTNLISGGKSARLKPLKKVDHVVISLAEKNDGYNVRKRSDAVTSPSELNIMDGTHYQNQVLNNNF